LDRDARYRVTDLDSQQSQEYAGAELLDRGLLVTIEQRPSAVVLQYTKLK